MNILHKGLQIKFLRTFTSIDWYESYTALILLLQFASFQNKIFTYLSNEFRFYIYILINHCACNVSKLCATIWSTSLSAIEASFSLFCPGGVQLGWGDAHGRRGGGGGQRCREQFCAGHSIIIFYVSFYKVPSFHPQKLWNAPYSWNF